MKFFSILLSLPAFCFAIEAENCHLSPDVSSKFVSFCQIIQQRDVIYEFGNQGSIPGKIFTPKESFEVAKHLKSGGTYRYNGSGKTDLMFQIPYSIGKVTKDSPLFCYEKSKGNLTLNFFLQRLGNYQSIIQGYEAWNQSEIKNFAGNVLAILERDAKGIVLFQKEHDIVNPALEIGALVLTSERLRSEKSLLLAYIEFLKLKHDPSQQRLKKMFLGKEPTLRFPKSQDHIFQTSIVQLLSEFSDLYTTVYKLKSNEEERNEEDFFSDIMWKLWKLHEVHWDFACALKVLTTTPIEPYASYIITPLINSAPKQLAGKLFDKSQSPVEVIRSNLTQSANMEYCQFIFSAVPEKFIEILIDSNNLFYCLKSVVDREDPDILCADWILTKIETRNRETAEQSVKSLINDVLLRFANIPQLAAYFLFSKSIQYTDQPEQKKFLKPWMTRRWNNREHLEQELTKAITEEYLRNKSLGPIFNMASNLGGFDFISKVEERLKEIKHDHLAFLRMEDAHWIEKFRLGIEIMLDRFRFRISLMTTPTYDIGLLFD